MKRILNNIMLLVLSGIMAAAQSPTVTTTPVPSCEEVTWVMRNWWLMAAFIAVPALIIGVVLTVMIMKRSYSGYQPVPSSHGALRPVIPAIITAPSRQAVFVTQA